MAKRSRNPVVCLPEGKTVHQIAGSWAAFYYAEAVSLVLNTEGDCRRSAGPCRLHLSLIRCYSGKSAILAVANADNWGIRKRNKTDVFFERLDLLKPPTKLNT